MEVSDIIASIDMAEYISQYCELEPKGGELWGLSPFRPENTPSFSVNLQKGYFYDFSAGFGGNLVDFVMKKENTNLYGAIRILKNYAGIVDSAEPRTVRLEATKVAKKYRPQVKQPPQCTAKIMPEDCMNRFEFRRDKLQLWADEGIQWDVMERRGVRYDAFEDRIVFPIRDYDGRIISICGRTCVPDFKAQKIRKYTYLQSIGTIDTLYGFSDSQHSILEAKEIILFEGAKSCMLAEGWGVHNTSAILTSHLSITQFRFLIRLSSFHGVRIVFALDSDVDIKKDENINKLLSYARVEWVKNVDGILQEKESPVDRGLDAWKVLYEKRMRMN